MAIYAIKNLKRTRRSASLHCAMTEEFAAEAAPTGKKKQKAGYAKAFPAFFVSLFLTDPWHYSLVLLKQQQVLRNVFFLERAKKSAGQHVISKQATGELAHVVGGDLVNILEYPG